MANKEQQIQHAGQLLQKLEAMAQTLRKLPGMVQHEKTFTPNSSDTREAEKQPIFSKGH